MTAEVILDLGGEGTSGKRSVLGLISNNASQPHRSEATLGLGGYLVFAYPAPFTFTVIVY